MRPIQVYQVPKHRLRVTYSDTTVSLTLAANATFEDIARTLDELPNQRYGGPLAIDVTLRAASHAALFI